MTTQYQKAAEGIMLQAPRPTHSDRFELEQQMIDCWQVIDDIKTMHQMGATADDMVSLVTVYEFKFKRMWTTFENLIRAEVL